MELVISLAILVLLLPSLFFVANTYQQECKRLHRQHRLQMEYTHFMLFVQNELKQGSDFQSEGKNLVFRRSSGDIIRYEWKDQQIVRSVQKKGSSTFQGRTILSAHVDAVAFVSAADGVTIDLRLQDQNARLDLCTTIMARGQAIDVEP
jgi:competence protein ComGF